MTTKRVISLVLRVGVSLALLVFLFTRIPSFEPDELLPDWNVATALWLTGALALTMTSFVLSTLRWRQVLVALGETRLGMTRLFSHYMAGQFVSNFVPTTVGGDLVRIARVSRDIGSGPVAFTSVLFERLSGWLVLPVVTYVGFAVNPGLVRLGVATRLPLFVATLTLAGLGVVLFVASRANVGRFLADRQGLLRYVSALHTGLEQLLADRRQAWRVVGSAFLYQAAVLLAATCAARAMGIDEVGPTALMAFLPAVLIVQVLPLGIGGLGLREAALVILFSRLGVPDERAIAFGLLLYFLVLACSLLGLPALVFGGRRLRSDDRDDTGAVLWEGR